MYMKRVLITGITGYIGSHLARALLPDCEVCGLVRLPLHNEYIADFQDKLRLYPSDGSFETIYSALQEIQPNLVYHLATYYTGTHSAQVTPNLIASNVTFGAYLLEAMAACGTPALVYATTVMAHYSGEAYRPLNLYAATKQALSDLITYYTDAGLLRAVTLTLSDTYGPDDRRPKVLNLIRDAAQEKKPVALSDGDQVYDVTYIDDVVCAFQLAGEQLLKRGEWKNENFQVYALHPLTLRQTVEMMTQVNGLKVEAEWGRRPAAMREIRQAVHIYPPLPGWMPEVDLKEGLMRFISG